MVEKMREEEVNFFWFSRLQLHTMWRQGEAPPEIRRAILSQVEVSLIRPEVQGMNEDLHAAPDSGPENPLTLYLPKGSSVLTVKGYFRADDFMWGWVTENNPEQEIIPLGWSK